MSEPNERKSSRPDVALHRLGCYVNEAVTLARTYRKLLSYMRAFFSNWYNLPIVQVICKKVKSSSVYSFCQGGQELNRRSSMWIMKESTERLDYISGEVNECDSTGVVALDIPKAFNRFCLFSLMQCMEFLVRVQI